MIQTQYSDISCGVTQLFNLFLLDGTEAAGAAREAVRDLICHIQFKLSHASTFIFSDQEGEYGDTIARYIEANPALGTLTRSPVTVNRNSRNRIQTYIWNLPEGPMTQVLDDMKKAIGWTKKDTTFAKKGYFGHDENW